jgi:hypothetical protein
MGMTVAGIIGREGSAAGHGVLRINSFDPERGAPGAAQPAEFDEGRRFVVNLWESDDDRVRGLASELIGDG